MTSTTGPRSEDHRPAEREEPGREQAGSSGAGADASPGVRPTAPPPEIGRVTTARGAVPPGTLVGAAVVAVCLGTFGVLAEQVVTGTGIARLDDVALSAALAARSPALTAALQALSAVGGDVLTPALTLLVMVGLVALRSSFEPLVLIAPAATGSFLLTLAGDRLVDRARPPFVDAIAPYSSSSSFPSGHALNAVTIAGIIAYALVSGRGSPATRRAAAGAAAAYTLVIGLSRVYLGQHWLTDVLAGWALGTAWLVAVVTLHRLAMALRTPPRPEVDGAAERARPSRPEASAPAPASHIVVAPPEGDADRPRSALRDADASHVV